MEIAKITQGTLRNAASHFLCGKINGFLKCPGSQKLRKRQLAVVHIIHQ